jgi:hypothetical protein
VTTNASEQIDPRGASRSNETALQELERAAVALKAPRKLKR